MMLPVVTRPVMSVLVWPFVFLVNLLAMGLAVVTGSLVSFALAIVVTLVLLVVAITKIPAELTGLPVMLLLIGGFALVFTAVAVWLLRLLSQQPKPADAAESAKEKLPRNGCRSCRQRLRRACPRCRRSRHFSCSCCWSGN